MTRSDVTGYFIKGSTANNFLYEVECAQNADTMTEQNLKAY